MHQLFTPQRFASSGALTRSAIAALFGFVAVTAQAGDLSFSGNLEFNTDVARVAFDIGAGAGEVKLWTDSWQAGKNFDPTAALWRQASGGYTLVAENDDDSSIGAGQGSFDSGLAFASLATGHYLVTVGAAPNFALGTRLADGFSFDGTTPIRIADWNQPSYDINANDQKGTLWSLHLTGNTVVSPVPEPSSYAMLLAGLGLGYGFMFLRRRR